MRKAFQEWHDEILEEKNPTIIGSLLDARIVDFEVTTKGCRVMEACDNYFGATLSPWQLDRLIDELKAIRNLLHGLKI